MRSIISLLTFLFLFTTALHSQLVTPGTGIRWNIDSLVAQGALAPSANGNYYTLGDHVSILAGDTVEVDSDDTIKVSGAYLITVFGTLNMVPPNECVVTSLNPAAKFTGFRFENTSGSHWNGAVILNAGGIKLVSAYVHFENCRFEGFDKSNSTGAIDAYQSHPLIRYCSFSNNAGPAIASGANAASSPQIYYSEFHHNNTSNANTPQINLGTSGSDTIRIIGNTIQGLYNMAGGIALSALIGGPVRAIVDSNVISNNRYGIACLGSDVRTWIRHNLITDNNIQNLPMQGGSGLNFMGGSGNVSYVSYNEIYGNLWGVTIQQNAQPNFGQIDPDTVNIGQNKIYDNGNGGVVYNLYNNTPGDIRAENNYWGSYIPDTVEAGIFHKVDDPSLGMVDFLPLSPLLTQAPSSGPVSGTALLASVFPNPASEWVQLQFGSSLLQEAGPVRLSLYDYSGRKVYSVSVSSSTPACQVPTSGLPGGLYLLEAIQAGQRQVVVLSVAH